jgi:fructoselysine and glucoselysine-specific PTS system IIB component
MLMVIVESIMDAYRMVKGCSIFKSVSIGYTEKRENCQTLTSWVWATPEEICLMKELLAKGIDVEMQNVPTSRAISVGKIIK